MSPAWLCPLHGCAPCTSCPGPHSEGPLTGFMLCCLCLKTFHTFEHRALPFHFALGCSHRKASRGHRPSVSPQTPEAWSLTDTEGRARLPPCRVQEGAQGPGQPQGGSPTCEHLWVAGLGPGWVRAQGSPLPTPSGSLPTLPSDFFFSIVVKYA